MSHTVRVIVAALAAASLATPARATITTTTMHTGGQLLSPGVLVRGGTDLAANGSFDGGLSGWSVSGPVSINMDQAHSAPPSIHIGSDAGPDASASQLLTLPSGVPVIADFWIGNKSGTSDPGITPMALKVYSFDGDRLGEVYLDPDPYGPGWHHCVADLSPYAGETVRLSFEAQGFTICIVGCSRAPAPQFDLDDVRILSSPEALFTRPGAQVRLYPLVYYVGGAFDSGYAKPEGTFYRIAPSPDNLLYTAQFDLPSGDGPQTASWYSYHKGIFETVRSLTATVDGTAPAAVLSLGAPFSVEGGTEKVANTSFEISGGWTFSAKGMVTTSDAHTGTQSAVVGATPTSRFYQAVSLAAGTEPALTFWSKGDRGSYSSLTIATPSGATLFAKHIGGGGWNQTGLSLAAFAGRSITLVFSGDSLGGSMLLDDISIRENAIVKAGAGSTHTFLTYDSGSGPGKLHFSDNGGPAQEATSLTLNTPGLHRIDFTAADVLGNEGGASVGLNVDAGPLHIWQVKQAAAGSQVPVQGKVVTGVFGVVGSGGSFYIADQSSPHTGIRVTSPVLPPVSPGDLVSLDGVTSVVDGELRMALGGFVNNDGDVAVAHPVMRNGDLGGGARGSQPGIDGASGINNIGSLVSTAGRVTAVVDGNSALYVDDGSARPDGSGNAGVRVQLNGAPARPVGTWVAVTGVSGVRVVNARLQRVVLARNSADVKNL